MKIYDTNSKSRITYIDRVAGSPRADLFKCTLHWQDEHTLLIAWAEYIKVARIRARSSVLPSSQPPTPALKGTSEKPTRTPTPPVNVPPLSVEITAVFQIDAMIAGILPYHTPLPSATSLSPPHSLSLSSSHSSQTPSTSFLLLAYTPPDNAHLQTDVLPQDSLAQKRRLANPPEVRIVSRKGEEEAMDGIDVEGYERYGCNDYGLDEVPSLPSHSSQSSSSSYGSSLTGGLLSPISGNGQRSPPGSPAPSIFGASSPPKPSSIKSAATATSSPNANANATASHPPLLKPGSHDKCFIIRSPRSIVLVRPRDRRDRIEWLVERNRFDEALREVDILEPEEGGVGTVTNVMNSLGKGKEKEKGDDWEERSERMRVGLLYLRWLIDNGKPSHILEEEENAD